MTEAYYYIATQFLAIIIILLISFRIYRDSNFARQKLALLVNLFAVLSFITDSIWAFVEFIDFSYTTKYLIFLCYYVFLILTSLFWLVYVEQELYTRSTYLVRLYIYGSLTFIMFVVLFTTPFSKILFYINENVLFVKGELWILLLLFPSALVITASVLAVRYSIKAEEVVEKKRGFILASFTLPPLLITSVLAFREDLPLACIGITIAIVLVYLNYQSESARVRNEQEAIIAALGDDYDCVYYINGKLNTIRVYRSGGEFQQFMPFIEGEYIAPPDFDSHLRHAIHPEDYKKFRMLTERVYVTTIIKERPYSVNFRIKFPDKELYFQLKFVSDKLNQTGIILGFQNIDSQMRQERQLLSELEEANKAKTNFLFNMSHDIRTPMNAIMGFTDMALKYADDKDRVVNNLKKVKSSGDHLLQLINDVLDMARIESGHVEIDESPVNIKKANEEICVMISEMARKKNIDFLVATEGVTNENIWVDKLHVNQVLLNILSNAVKYTKPYGKVNYTLQQTQGNDKNSVKLTFIVQDTGIGMSRDFVKNVFEAFSREQSATKSGVEGTGLGMAITKRLVDLMKGKIKIESESGKGTTVTCSFNFRIWNVMEMAEQNETEDSSISLKGKRVLLVEDNELNREIAVDLLLDEDILVEEAEDGAVAVEKFKASPVGHFDFILMDVQMPYKDGYSATREIRVMKKEDAKTVPIIAMTANAFDEDKKKALEAGMNAHLAKPVNINDLLSTLKSFVK